MTPDPDLKSLGGLTPLFQAIVDIKTHRMPFAHAHRNCEAMLRDGSDPGQPLGMSLGIRDDITRVPGQIPYHAVVRTDFMQAGKLDEKHIQPWATPDTTATALLMQLADEMEAECSHLAGGPLHKEVEMVRDLAIKSSYAEEHHKMPLVDQRRMRVSDFLDLKMSEHLKSKGHSTTYRRDKDKGNPRHGKSRHLEDGPRDQPW